MLVPEIRFAITDDDVRIAYQDFGSGPTVLYVLPFFSHLEVQWEQPLISRVYERMGRYLRVLLVENRGTGLSDRTEALPTLEDRMLDIEAVVNSANLDELSLLGPFAGAQMCVAYAARHPVRVEHLVLANPRVGRSLKDQADALKTDAPGPLAYTFQTEKRMMSTAARLGSGLKQSDLETIGSHSPSALDHPEYLRWLPRYERMWGSRESVRRQAESIGPLDIADIAPMVRTPTLITHTADNGILHVGYGRLLNQLLPNSKIIEFPGRDHFYWLGSNWHEIVDAQIEFIAGVTVEAPAERHFAVVMFTDIVSSTETSVAAGDSRWGRVLEQHESVTREVVGRHGGRVVKDTGDGFLCTLSSPSSAVDAAIALRRALSEIGIAIRVGLHAGEIESRGNDVAGAAVNVAARVVEVAEDDEIFTTASMSDLLLGSDHRFADAGEHDLKGFDRSWRLFRVVPTT